MGQASPTKSEAALPATSDWSQHHLIFSKPATAKQAKLVEGEPRYRQQFRRQSPARLSEAEIGGGHAPELQAHVEASRRGRNRSLDGDWSEDMGSGATVGTVNYPAKYSLGINAANCANDFVVYGTGLTGGAGQADIAAYDNLYSGCGATVPLAYWGYNTLGTVTTSPVFSSDGTQIAFVQTDSDGNGILVLLKWAPSSGTVGSPITLARSRNSDYPTCTVPCMSTTLLTDASSAPDPDTNSSVYYDYDSDTAYVGDDDGWLHQFTPVFNGIPAEVRTGGWPVQVNPGSPTALASPVYDPVSGNVFLADIGGFLYRVDSGATATVSGQLDFSRAAHGAGIVQGPIVDASAERVYVFSSSDGSTACTGGAACAAVFQFGVDFIGGTFGTEVTVGASTVSGSAPNPLYLGAFDSTYKNSVNATGNLYVCGDTGGTPILYQVPITAGAFGTAVPGPQLSSTTPGTPCSPVTDVMNPNASGGATEWLFASAETGGVSSGCSGGGCILNFIDTPWQPSTAYAVGQEVLDSHFQIQVVVLAFGPSGATAPDWGTTVGGVTSDHLVVWLDQGVQSAFTPPAWAADTSYSDNAKILDSHNNIQLETVAGTSGGTIPTFSETPGGTTDDGTVVWTNVGAIATAAMAAAGGTSGIVIDNIVGSGTLGGASQVYFSTLNDQTCATSGGSGGCAVQASQSGLQ
jgi:hypothetical protein